jgi:ABC-type lipoprotein export system ATPase subunit
VIEVRDLHFEHPGGGFVLRVPELRVARGEKVGVVGPSGSGKTTLVNLVTGILRPLGGSIRVDGIELVGRPDIELRNLRISKIGFIFQEFELLDYLTVLENIVLPYMVNRMLTYDSAVRRHAIDLAESVGLGPMISRRPAELSHGERQRVAICRALIAEPPIVIADEPTGNLDRKTADAIVEIIHQQVTSRGATLVMVTHDTALLGALDSAIDLGKARYREGPSEHA